MMRLLDIIRLRLRSLFRGGKLDRELDEELRYHLERQIEENIAGGMAPDEARKAVLRSVAGLTQRKEECREARGWGVLESVGRMRMRLRHVVRRLARTPVFTAVAAVTLAIGIGANGAIFSVINGILLKPLPYPHPDELIDLTLTAPGVKLAEADEAPFLYFTYREGGRTFQSVGLYRWGSNSVTELAEPEQAESLNVTAEVLPMLGVNAVLGRWFSARDDAPGSPRTMILTYGWWQARFGGSPSVIGRRILVDGVAREVIGVMPASFEFLDRNPAFLLPLQLDRNKEFLGHFDYPGIARLKPGATIEQASADIARMIPLALHSFPPQTGLTVKEFEDVRLAPKLRYLRQFLIGDIARTLWVVMGTIGIVLLIACANIANLLLVRAEGRQQELAIQAALGAGRREIAWELLMESVALGALGGALGLGLAYGAIRALVASAPAQLPRLHEIAMDPTAIGFTTGATLVTSILFGLIPVIKYGAPRLENALRGSRGATHGRERNRARSVLVVVQVALALVLLLGAGLMIRTFQALRRVDPGFDPHNALSFRLSIPESQVKDATAVIRLEQDILEKLRAIPGVAAAGLTSVIPSESSGADLVYARDKTYSQKAPPLRWMKFVSPGVLAAMGNRLIAGREFTWADTYERRPVAMMSENLARDLWGDPKLAIGKEIRENLTGPWRQVIGVVNDEREDGVQVKAPPVAYYPLLMNDFESKPVAVRRVGWYVVRSNRAGSPALLADIQRAVWSANPALPLSKVRTLEEIYRKSLARTSLMLVMLTIAGAMALLIGLVGIYGVISYSVSNRTREIGIRMALGARKAELTRAFVAHGIVLALIGVGAGLLGGAALSRVLGSLLYDVNAHDPLTYGAVSMVMVGAAAIASYAPAVRAAGVDPIESVRAQ